MARDGSGNYSLPSGNPVGTGTTISSTTHNTTMSDIASAITASIAKDGQTTPTANLPMGTYRHTGVSSGTARDQYAAVAQLQDGGAQYVGSVSGVDTITGSLTPAISAYATGMMVILPPAGSNTTSVTLALNGLAAKAVIMPDGNQCLPGDLRVGLPVMLVYNGTSFVFVSTNQVPVSFTITLTGVSGTVTSTAIANRVGRVVTLTIPSMSGTSNATTLTLTGLPTTIRPAFDQRVAFPTAINNGVVTVGDVDAIFGGGTGTITLALAADSAGWTASGIKGVQTSTITYQI